jgi:hypothetical protein
MVSTGLGLLDVTMQVLASGSWYASATLWAAAGVVAVLVVGAATIMATYRVAANRQKLVYTLRHTPLLSRNASYGDLLTVTYSGKQITEPAVLSIWLTNVGKKDIPSSAFDGARPIVVDVRTRIVALLPTGRKFGGESIPSDEIGFNGSCLSIAPTLIRARWSVVAELLVDGSIGDVTVTSPLIDVDVTPNLPGNLSVLGTVMDMLSRRELRAEDTSPR